VTLENLDTENGEHSHTDGESHEENRRRWRQVSRSLGDLKVSIQVSVDANKTGHGVMSVSVLYTVGDEVLMRCRCR